MAEVVLPRRPLGSSVRVVAEVEPRPVVANVLPHVARWSEDVCAAPVALAQAERLAHAVPTRPVWRPSDAQMTALTDRLRTWLAERDPTFHSVTGPNVRGIDVSDMDLTLLDTVLRMPLLDGKDQPVRYPGTKTPVVLGAGPERNQDAELDELYEQYPQLEEKPGLHFDRDALTNGDLLRHTPTIGPTLRALTEASGDSSRRTFVLTARSGTEVMTALQDVLAEHRVPVTGVLGSGVSNGDEFGLAELGLNAAQRKAVMLSALVRAYGANVRDVRFVDDNPDFLRAVMELLPAEHPQTNFELWGVRRRTSGEYRMWPVINYRGDLGAFLRPFGNAPLDAAGQARQLARYEAHSAPAADLNPRP